MPPAPGAGRLTAKVDVGSATATSSAPPEAFHERWCDVETHPEWASSMEFFRLDGEFGVGVTGTLKSRGGPEARFQVVEVGERTYADATDLDGAELVVHHEAQPNGSGGSGLTLRAWVEGPDAEVRAEEVGDISGALQGDLDALVGLLEGP